MIIRSTLSAVLVATTLFGATAPAFADSKPMTYEQYLEWSRARNHNGGQADSVRQPQRIDSLAARGHDNRAVYQAPRSDAYRNHQGWNNDHRVANRDWDNHHSDNDSNGVALGLGLAAVGAAALYALSSPSSHSEPVQTYYQPVQAVPSYVKTAPVTYQATPVYTTSDPYVYSQPTYYTAPDTYAPIAPATYQTSSTIYSTPTVYDQPNTYYGDTVYVSPVSTSIY